MNVFKITKRKVGNLVVLGAAALLAQGFYVINHPVGEQTLFTSQALAQTYVAPYNATKFRPVLDQAYLQYPDSTQVASTSDIQNGYAASYFQLITTSSNQYMQFEKGGASTRAELHGTTYWNVASSTQHKLDGYVKLFDPASDVGEATIAQIHMQSSNSGKPFARIAFRANFNGQTDHLWAVVRDDDSSNSNYTEFDLGPVVFSNHVRLTVSTQSGKLNVSYNGVSIPTQNINSSWNNKNTYFKAGAYVQSGTSLVKVQYKELTFTH